MAQSSSVPSSLARALASLSCQSTIATISRMGSQPASSVTTSARQLSIAMTPASCLYLDDPLSSCRSSAFSLALRSLLCTREVKLLASSLCDRLTEASTARSTSAYSDIEYYKARHLITSMQGYLNLQRKIQTLEEEVERQGKAGKERQARRKEELIDLQENFEERNNSIISKMEELRRKETLLITLKRIEPEIPEGFPKNYFCQLVYEDTTLTGSQKFTDFDDNLIEEKFVLPLLFSSAVKVEIWTAEDEPSLWAKAEINLERDIETALVSQACMGQLPLSTSQSTLSYRLQLQGIGFSTWLRNIAEMRSLQAEKAYSREQGQVRKEQVKAKIHEKKQRFHAKFERQKESTSEIRTTTIEALLEELGSD